MPTTAKVIWFEITSDDPTAARAFYENLFVWSAEGSTRILVPAQA